MKSIFELPEFSHLAGAFEKRRTRARRNWAYYKADIYKSPTSGADGSAIGRMVIKRISDSILPVFTPIARAVGIDVSLMPGGWVLHPVGAGLTPLVNRVFADSRWKVEGQMAVRFFTVFGEVGLYCVPSVSNRNVIIQAVRPDEFITQTAGRYDDTIHQAILFQYSVDLDGNDVEDATVIDPNEIRTFRNGEPWRFDERDVAYPNPLGFVPLVVCVNDPGDGVGEPTFDDVISSLDQANLQATYLANIIQKHVEPQWAMLGAEPGELTKSGDSVWFLPEGADVKAVLAAVDFEGVLAFIQDMKNEVKDGLPELALSKLVGVERVAAATIELQMSECVFKIRRLRPYMDQCLADALRMCGRAAGVFGWDDLRNLDDPSLQFDEERPVITMDILTKLQIAREQSTGETQRLALESERLLMAGRMGGDA